MLTLGLPSRGRLAEGAESIAKLTGLNTARAPRSLQSDHQVREVRIVFAHSKDIGMLVKLGCLDLGITAEDILAEHPVNIEILGHLGFGRCRLVLASRRDSEYSRASDFENAAIATSYPRIARRWFANLRKNVRVLPVHGAEEIMPWLGFAPGIIVSCQTGATVQANHLRVIDTVMISQAVLIGRSRTGAKELELAKVICGAARSYQADREGEIRV